MNLIKVIFLLFVYINCMSFAKGEDSLQDLFNDAVKKYDDLIKLSLPSPTATPVPKNTINALLPDLSDVLFSNWKINEPVYIWKKGDPIPDFARQIEPLLNELALEEILGQSYIKDGHKSEVFIYRFQDSPRAFSAFTILKRGEKSKLKIGKRSTESNGLINFWKGNYFIDVHSASLGDAISKEFVVLASQDISKNILEDKPFPAVVLQLPSLNRVQDSERFCTGLICAMQFLPQFVGIDYSSFNIGQSEGISSARYKALEKVTEKNEEYLILSRYSSREIARSVFLVIKNTLSEQFIGNKDYEISFDESKSVIKLKNKNNEYLVIKQSDSLIKISFGKISLSNCEKLIDLVL